MTFYALRYRRKRVKGPVTVFYNPASSDKDYMVRQAELMFRQRNKDSLGIGSVQVVAFEESAVVWNSDDQGEVVQGPAVLGEVQAPG